MYFAAVLKSLKLLSSYNILATRIGFYFADNGVKEADILRAALFSVCSAATYKLIKNLLTSAKPAKVEFKDIVIKALD